MAIQHHGAIVEEAQLPKDAGSGKSVAVSCEPQMEIVQGKLMTGAPESGAYALRKIVAVVDDDPGILRALVSWLDYHQLRATHHSSGESLLSLLRHKDGNLLMTLGVMDAVPFVLAGAVLDVNLADISGMEVARRLRAMCPNLPIVVVTALPKDDLERYGVLPEGVQCLRKPFDLDALEAALFPLLEQPPLKN
jgi:DNA-binding response OmpR family regulator